MRSHGVPKKEADRGQRAVTAADLEKLGNVTNKPNSVSKSTKEWRGLPCIIYEKAYGNERFFYVETISEKLYKTQFISLRIHVKKSGPAL